MLLLRVTSSDRVIGIQSDDDFTIGRVHPRRDLQPVAARRGVRDPRSRRLSLVAPRLIGPVWFRRVTVGLASGAVAGSMLVHADGIDFTQLTPKWLAIGLFVALPAVFGKFIGPAFDAVSAPDSWAATGRRRWLIPVIAIACFPPTILPGPHDRCRRRAVHQHRRSRPRPQTASHRGCHADHPRGLAAHRRRRSQRTDQRHRRPDLKNSIARPTPQPNVPMGSTDVPSGRCRHGSGNGSNQRKSVKQLPGHSVQPVP
jgi:hypothetical protein